MAKGGDRKIGRNKARCAAYRLNNKRGINKVRDLYKYLRKHPGDAVARASYDKHLVLIPHKFRALYMLEE